MSDRAQPPAPQPEDQPERAPTGTSNYNPALVYLAGLPSEHSRRTMRAALDTIAFLLMKGRLPQTPKERTAAQGLAIVADQRWGQLRYAHTQAVRAALIPHYKPATVNKLLSALRGILKEAWRLGYMTAEDYHRAADLKSVRGSTVPTGRDLAGGELQALFDACAQDGSPAGARDAALLALLRAGLRRAEIVELDVADFDADQARLLVQGKGNRERTVYLDPGGVQALKDWLLARGRTPGALLLPVNKGGRIVHTRESGQLKGQPARLTSQAVYNALKKRGELAGLTEFSPHDFRRTFVGDLLDAGADLSTVARLAGHANVQTTARYDRRDEAAKRKAANLLHTPYASRRPRDDRQG